MTKILVMPNKKEDISEFISEVDAILLGITDFSVNFTEISLDELKSIAAEVKQNQKELFISLNKNMHNGDLEKLEEILKQCEQLKIDGIFYYDVAVLQIHNQLNLTVPLIWSAEHLTTNQYTIQYWKNEGIQGVFLSNEITKEEILEIQKNSQVICITQVFGHLPMYVSQRHAIENYLKHFHLSTDSPKFYLWKEEKQYPILERKIGTEIYSNFLLNAIVEYLEYQKNKMDYAFISGFSIPLEKLKVVIQCFQTVTEENAQEKKEKIESLFSNTGTGFLYKETIYQVKKNEK
jgi:collagenase-like PrtC family protease